MVDPDSYREVDTTIGVLEQIITICSDGGTGRHAGLKILFALKRVRVRFPLRVQKALWKQGAFVIYKLLHFTPTQKRVRVRPDSYRDPLRVQSSLHPKEDFLFSLSLKSALKFY